MITSKLTSKAQTTIPQPIRTALGLGEGDAIVYTMEADGRVMISRVKDQAVEDPFATFSEWDSEADRKAYGTL
jgi:antitoxin PrlF